MFVSDLSREPLFANLLSVFKQLTIFICCFSHDFCFGIAPVQIVKFRHCEKVIKFEKLLTVCTVVKSKGKISQNFVSFSEYMNFSGKGWKDVIIRKPSESFSVEKRKVTSS